MEMENKNNLEQEIYTAIDPVFAAISMALYECNGNNIHDRETNVLTIDASKQCSGAWKSKVLTLRHAPK